MLEHVADLDRVLAETARVLKPGGVYFFDTVNRTPLSNLLVIKALQEWRLTRMMPPNLHVWHKFITPAELRGDPARHGIVVGGMAGFGPTVDPLTMIRLLRRRNAGKLTYAELGTQARVRRIKSLSTSYMGYAIRKRP